MNKPDEFALPTPTVRLPELEQLFCGFIIDDEGHERPITEVMIRDACAALEEAAITGLHAHPPR